MTDCVDNRIHLIKTLEELRYINMAKYLSISSYGYERHILSPVYLTQVYTCHFLSLWTNLDNAKVRRIDIKPHNSVRNFLARELKSRKLNIVERRKIAIEIVLKNYSTKQ